MDKRESHHEIGVSSSLVGKRFIVRVNSITSSHGALDIAAVGALGELVEGMGIPKVSVADADLLSPIVHPSHDLWAFFETPRSIIDANAICASGRYQVAAMGLNDLSLELHLPLRYHMSSGGSSEGGNEGERESNLFSRRLPLLHAMSTVITAARAWGMRPLDGVYNNPSDKTGFEIECREALSLGFSGKPLFHPSQIDIIHGVYAPSAAEASWANKVINAIKESHGGVAVVDGKMVEDLHAKMAMRIMSHSLGDKGL